MLPGPLGAYKCFLGLDDSLVINFELRTGTASK